MENIKWAIPIFLVMLSLAWQVYSWNRGRRDKSDEERQKEFVSLKATVQNHDNQLVQFGKTQTQIVESLRLLLKDVMVSAAQLFHSPHTPEFDRLLEKLQKSIQESNAPRLRPEELNQLCRDLLYLKEHDPDQKRRWTAMIFLHALEREYPIR